ncbi:MAG: PEP-CTERM sorting domain-containing protein [Alphaproteobacteria bacterium]|nr:PEP-CTERM sorting domain-containing protein [Alphaproteobacteria bacterium]
MASSTALAAIVHTTFNSALGTAGTPTTLDLGGDAGDEYILSYTGIGASGIYTVTGSTAGLDQVLATPGAPDTIFAVAKDTAINAAIETSPPDFVDTASLTVSGVSTPGLGDIFFVALAFDIGGATHYGWARLRTDTFSSGGAILIDVAFNDDPGGTILAGQVPEPGTMGLMGLGLLAAGLLRRRIS